MEHSVLNDVSPSNSSLWFRELYGRRAIKTGKVRGGGRHIKATRPSGHNVPTHTCKQRLRQHAQGLHRSKPGGAPALRGEWRPAHILTRKLYAICKTTACRRKALYLQWRLFGYTRVPRYRNQMAERQAPCLARLPTQNRLYGIFGDSSCCLIMLCLGCFFLGGGNL